MSVRRETVYWHGCADGECESDSHGCSRVEIWWETLGPQETIAYVYDESIHCLACAEARFGRDEQGLISGTDTQGNAPVDLAPWDEWWDTTAPSCQFLHCGSCEVVIDESHDELTCECSQRDGVARLRKSA